LIVNDKKAKASKVGVKCDNQWLQKKGWGDSILSGAIMLVGEGEMIVTKTGVSLSLGTIQMLIPNIRALFQCSSGKSIRLIFVNLLTSVSVTHASKIGSF
jgi:hypothetical protein